MAARRIDFATSSRRLVIARLMVTAGACAGFAGSARAQQNGPVITTPTAPPQTTIQSPQPSTTEQSAPAPATAPGAAAVPAQAPAQPGEPASTEGGDIVVTGYRRSIEASLAQKRQANSFVDVITAEDVGKFPDKNVADSLQRVPGVVIERDGGEGNRVSIRGLSSDLTLTELNGNFIASADSSDPSRSFSYVLLPSNLIASVETYKSPEARFDEGGVGGLIINRTRKPFDLEPWSGNIQAEGTYADVTKKVEPNASGLISWHNEDKTLGFLVGATYQERTNRELRANGDSWQWWTYGGRATGKPATDVNGNPYANDDAISYWSENTGTTTQGGTRYDGYWAPQSVSQTIVDQQRKRLGIQATAQMRPIEDLTITANYFRFQLDNHSTQSTIKIPEWGYKNFFTAATLDKSGTIFQGATFQVPAEGTGCRVPKTTSDGPSPCTMETPASQDYLTREKAVSNTYDVHIDWSHDRFEASAVLGKTRATGGPSFQFYAQSKPRLTNGAALNADSLAKNVNGNMLSQWAFGKQSLSTQFSPELIQNIQNGIAQIDVGSTGSGYTNSSISQRYAQLDLTRHFDTFIDSIQLGAKWRDGRVHRETGEFRWYSDAANSIRFQDTDGGSAAKPEFFYPNSLGNIAGGFDTTAFPAINIRKYIDYLNQTYNGPVNYPQPENLYNIRERIWAGYAQVNYKTGPVRGNLGLRVVNTKQSGLSTDVLFYDDDYCRDGPGGPFDPNRPVAGDGNCQIIPENQRQRRVYTPNNESKSYTDFLPSFNISWDVTSNLLLRGAVSKVIARPSYNDLAGNRQLTFESDAWAFDRAQFGGRPGWFGNGGNFDLKPFSAWQYDAGVEWYFRPGSVLGMSLFRKDVSNFIVPVVIDLPQEVAGQTVTVQQYATQANGSKAVSQGVELYAQHTLSFGLGAQVNFTYNDTSTANISLGGANIGTSPLVGSAKTQVNASLFYEHNGILLRGSYNRRGERVGGLSSGLNVYDDPYQQVDLNAAYDITPNLQLTASVINLTKEEERQHLGNDTKDRFVQNKYNGRRVYVGVSYKF